MLYNSDLNVAIIKRIKNNIQSTSELLALYFLSRWKL